MATHILLRNNHLLDYHVQQSMPHIIISKLGELKFFHEGKTYSFQINKNEYVEASPTPIYFNTSNQTFFLSKEHDRNRDLNDFFELHDFGLLIGSITILSDNVYLTMAQPAKIELPDGSYKSYSATTHKSTIRSLIDINPEFENHPNILKRRARVKMLSGINPVESLADLEKQVDFLTKALSALVTDEDVKSKLDMFLKNSSYSYKTEPEIVKDVLNRKAQLRDAMKPYLEVKQNAIQNPV